MLYGSDFVPRMTRRRWVFVLLAMIGVATAWAIAFLDLSHIDPYAIAAQIREVGALGPIVLLALLALQCVVAPLPSEPLMMAAGFVYGAAGGFVISWIGVVAGASACFGLARRYGRPFAQRFVSADKLAMLDAFAGEQGLPATFFAVMSLRLFAFAAFDVVSYAAGLIRFPFRWFLLATVLGAIPKAFAFTYFGATVSDRPGWLDWLVTAGTFGALLIVPWLIRAWRKTRMGLAASPLPRETGVS